VDISKLKIGGTTAVETLLNDDYTILHPDSTAVVQVKASRNAIEEEEEEEEGEEGAAEGAEGAPAEAAASEGGE